MSQSSLPKLLPLWHDISIDEGHKKICHCTFDRELYPDHGGAGVDVHVKNNEIECEQLKLVQNVANYGSEMCALPFLPPNKVNSLDDPCLGRLLKRREKQTVFCRGLQHARQQMTSTEKYRKTILSSREEILKHIASGEQDEISVPKQAIDLAKRFSERFPIPQARWEFIGGSLAVSSFSTFHLLHPTGRKLTQLAVTPLEENSNGFEVSSDQNHLTIPVKGGKIFQIAVNSSFGVSCVRKNKAYHYISLNNVFEGKSKSYSVESYCLDEKLSDVKLSSYIPGEHLVIANSGLLFLENAHVKKRIWQLDEPLTHSPLVEDLFWCCDFGSHPRSILYSDRQCFTTLDLRSKRPKAVDILSLPNPFFLNEEQLTVTKRLECTYFQHLVATNLHLFIFDERYPQQPLISWSHMLGSVPLYCDVKPYKSKSGISEFVGLLATQESADIASFHFSCSSSRVQPLSLSQPLHLSNPQDCVKTLKLHSEYVDDRIITRLGSPLIGVCAIPHSDNNRYTVLQLNSFGDVFYQQFHPVTDDEKSFRVGPGCVLLPPEKILPHLSSWLKAATVGVKEVHEKLGKNIVYANVDELEVLNSACERARSVKCLFCKPREYMPETGECNSDICPRCSLHNSFEKQLLECAENDKIFCGSFPQGGEECSEGRDNNLVPFQLVDLSKVTDPLSKRFLKVWEDKNVEESQQPGASIAQNRFHEKLHGLSTENQRMVGANSHIMTSQEKSGNEVWSQQTCLDESIVPPSQELSCIDALYTSKRNRSKKIKLSSSLGF